MQSSLVRDEHGQARFVNSAGCKRPRLFRRSISIKPNQISDLQVLLAIGRWHMTFPESDAEARARLRMPREELSMKADMWIWIICGHSDQSFRYLGLASFKARLLIIASWVNRKV